MTSSDIARLRHEHEAMARNLLCAQSGDEHSHSRRLPAEASGGSHPLSPTLDQMLGIADMKRVLNLGNTAIYEGVKTGALPKPYRVFGRRVAWKASEVQAYLDSLQRVGAEGGAA